VPPHLLLELENFFSTYKTMQHLTTEVRRFMNEEEAIAVLDECYERYRRIEETETLAEEYMMDDAEAMRRAQQQQISNNQMKYTVIIVSSLPMLIAYPFFQQYFVKGVMLGSLKE